jgi:hypothetical protein
MVVSRDDLTCEDRDAWQGIMRSGKSQCTSIRPRIYTYCSSNQNRPCETSDRTVNLQQPHSSTDQHNSASIATTQPVFKSAIMWGPNLVGERANHTLPWLGIQSMADLTLMSELAIYNAAQDQGPISAYWLETLIGQPNLSPAKRSQA